MTDVALDATTPAAAPAAEPKRDRRGRAPMNPVLARELKIRLRGGRAWLLLSIYLVILAAIVYFVYQAESGGTGDPFSVPSPTRFAAVGRSVFEALVFFMLLLVLFLVPGLTSGAIAGERDRQTLVPLQVTLLRPWQVVVGKLGSSFAFLALLVLATMPMLSIAYLIGGVTVGAVLKGIAVVLFCGIVVTCLSVACSALFRRVQVATVAAYGLVLVLVIGSTLAWGAAAVIDETRGDDAANPPAAILAVNPFFTAADVLDDDESTISVGLGSSPFEIMERMLDQSRYGTSSNEGEWFVDGRGVPMPMPAVDFAEGGGRIAVFAAAGGGDVGFGGGGQLGLGPNGRPIIGFDADGNPVEASETGFPFWALSVITLYVLAVGSILYAARRLRTPAATER